MDTRGADATKRERNGYEQKKGPVLALKTVRARRVGRGNGGAAARKDPVSEAARHEDHGPEAAAEKENDTGAGTAGGGRGED